MAERMPDKLVELAAEAIDSENAAQRRKCGFAASPVALAEVALGTVWPLVQELMDAAMPALGALQAESEANDEDGHQARASALHVTHERLAGALAALREACDE